MPSSYFPLHLFLERLSSAGIYVSVRDYQRISRVLAAEGDWTLARLERVLGNLLVRDRDERLLFQHEFRAFFKAGLGLDTPAIDVQRWREDIAQLLKADFPLPPLEEELPSSFPLSGGGQESVPPSGSSPDKGRLGGVSSWRWIITAVVGIVVLAVILKLTVFKPEPPVVTQPPIPQPTTPQINTLNGKPPTPDIPKPHEPIADMPAALVLALLMVGLIGWWWMQFRPPKIRQKIFCDPNLQGQYFDDASVGGTMPPWLTEAEADHLADVLKYVLTDQYCRELDIDASIHVTSESGSLPVLCFRRRRDLQKILILTDQLAPQQEWHQLPTELARALRARGIQVTFGRFNHSPEYFIDQHGRVRRLEDWEEYRHHLLLLIFADTYQAEGLQDFPWRDWPDSRLLTRRERRNWDFREQGLLAQGVKLLQADSEGIQKAWGELPPQPVALETARWEVEGQKPDEVTAEFLQRVLGEALPWAQALAHYPGGWSLAAAEQLRGALYPYVSRLALQRLLGLPGTLLVVGVAVFTPRIQATLRLGFMQCSRVEQEAVIREWLVMMEAAEPLLSPVPNRERKKDKKVSLAWAIWCWKLIRLEWPLDPDKAAEAMHSLVVSAPVLGEAIREEIGQTAEAESVSLLPVPQTLKGQRHLLGVGDICGLQKADVYAPAHKHRNGELVSAAMAIVLLAVVLVGGCVGNWIVPPPKAVQDSKKELAPMMVQIPKDAEGTLGECKQATGENGAAASLSVNASVDRNVYTIGDDLTLEVTPSADAYITVIDQGSNHDVLERGHVLFMDTFVKGNKTYTFPPPNSGQKIKVSDPIGLKTFEIVASRSSRTQGDAEKNGMSAKGDAEKNGMSAKQGDINLRPDKPFREVSTEVRCILSFGITVK